jgi:predicted flap endonuclease-1-like 5' DNA nuclease
MSDSQNAGAGQSSPRQSDSVTGIRPARDVLQATDPRTRHISGEQPAQRSSPSIPAVAPPPPAGRTASIPAPPPAAGMGSRPPGELQPAVVPSHITATGLKPVSVPPGVVRAASSVTTSSGQRSAPSVPPPVPPEALARSLSKAPPPLPSQRASVAPPMPSVAPAASPFTRSSAPPPSAARSNHVPAGQPAAPRVSSVPPPPPPRDDTRQQLATALADLREARLELEELRKQVKGRDTHIAEQRAQLAERDASLETLRQQAADHEVAIAELRKQLAEQQSRVAEPAPVGDDLKRIKGIGPGFERTLKAAGITTFAAIAAWTPEDIQRIATLLNTQPGRLEKGDWIGQAKALVQ